MNLNPDNKESRENFELAKRKLKEQEDKKNQKNNQDEQKDQNKKQNDQQQNKQEENQDQTQAQQDAQNVLKAIEEMEKEDLKKKNKNAAKYKTGKYW